MQISAESCHTIGILAWCLVVLVQTPDVLVYLTASSSVPTPCVERHAPQPVAHRPARCEKGSNVVSRSRHEPEYNVLNEVVIEKATYA